MSYYGPPRGGGRGYQRGGRGYQQSRGGGYKRDRDEHDQGQQAYRHPRVSNELTIQQRLDRALERQAEEAARSRELDRREEAVRATLASFGVTDLGPWVANLDINETIRICEQEWNRQYDERQQARPEAEANAAAEGNAAGAQEVEMDDAEEDGAEAQGSGAVAIDDDDIDMELPGETANEDGAQVPNSAIVSGAQEIQGDGREASANETGAAAPVSAAETTGQVSTGQDQTAVLGSGTRDEEAQPPSTNVSGLETMTAAPPQGTGRPKAKPKKAWEDHCCERYFIQGNCPGGCRQLHVMRAEFVYSTVFQKALAAGSLPQRTIEEMGRIEKRDRDADARRLAGHDDRSAKVGHGVHNKRR